jgi:hypothetical protein
MAEAQATARTEEESSAIAVPEVVQSAHERFGDPKNFINRELSWLEFNRRVLEEAQDQRQPLIERVKFLTISSSNLDEFFEIRVAGIKQQIESETSDVGPDGLSPTEIFDRIQKTYALERRVAPGAGEEWDLRARNRGLTDETRGVGTPLFSTGSCANADAAGSGRQSSVSASLEPQSQFTRPRKGRASWRAAACDRASAAGGSAIDPDAAGERRRRTVGVHLSRLSH